MSSSPWDAYSQHTGLPASLDPYAHPFSSDMRSLAAGGSAAPGMGSLTGESMLGYPKPSDLSAANLNLASPYAGYGQTYPGMPDLGFPSSSLARPSTSSHSPGVAGENLPAASPHGQFSGTPTSDHQSSSPTFSSSTSLYTPSTITSSISSSPYAQAFGGTGSADPGRGAPFSPFAQSYGYPMYGYNQVGGFPSSNSLDGVNRYMSGISSSQLMQSSAMGLYSNSQPGQMPFPYHPSMGWGPTIPGFPIKDSTDLMSSEELERYRYRQLSNPYFPGLPPGGPPGRTFPPHPLQSGMMRNPPFLDDRAHSPAPKKPKKAPEESERPPTPAPRDPASFHSQRGIYLFTSNAEPGTPKFFADRYVSFERELCEKLSRVSLPGKIQYVYNPLEYAFDSHMKFVRRFCTGEKYILFVGMNPGPFGMSQNGVPFGECSIVKEWLQIDGEVLKPVLEHPKRRVVGLECSRSEVTGGRFWQLFRTLCHTPEHFFRTSFVHNLCPFAFLTDGGKNVTPPQLTSSVLDQINTLCNATLVDVVRLLKCKYVICIGKYALAQAQKALAADEFNGVTLECLMHPSPINPAANKGWADIAIKQLTEIGVIDIIRYGRVPYQPSNQQPSLSHSSSASASSMSHVPHHSHPYHNKQSPGHYGFQSPPMQSYHHSPAQGSNNHQGALVHQSPAHATSTSRNQSSPAHASSRTQSSPAHSSCSQSPAQQQGGPQGPPSQSPAGNSSSVSDHHKDLDRGKDSNSGDINSEISQENKGGMGQMGTNGIPSYPTDRDPSGPENGIHNSQSETGSQGSELSKGNSPNSLPISSGNPQSNISEAQLLGAPGGPQMPMSHPHIGMSGLPMSSSPGLQGTTSDPHGSLANQGMGGSPQINSHMGSLNSHMGGGGPMQGMASGVPSSHAQQMPLGMHGGAMGSMNPYGVSQGMDMAGAYGGPGMPLNYPGGSSGYPPHMMSSMGAGSGMPGMSAGGMHAGGGMSSQMGGMFNPHMSRMMGNSTAEQMGMHAGMAAMYDSSSQMGAKDMPYGSHYPDKPPECT
ncbi:hypothetical protein RRG08_027660 [Elysia crispata]|uniref:Uracil-DNA glycosylase-like domain-containing protein n=1 Tax=Elysia crispata TaxID=231223 RepID=A0AAE0XM40_9GAST|nr:hypothetical protein RRG08_027660 [Elysia crispata]